MVYVLGTPRTFRTRRAGRCPEQGFQLQNMAVGLLGASLDPQSGVGNTTAWVTFYHA